MCWPGSDPAGWIKKYAGELGMVIIIIITLALAFLFLSLYSRSKLRVVEIISGKKQSIFDQFTIKGDVVNFDKYLDEHSQMISKSPELIVLTKRAKKFYWLQGVMGALLFFEFVLLLLW